MGLSGGIGVRKMVWMAALALLLLALAAWGWWRISLPTAPSYRFAPIERGTIVEAVSASGIVNPVSLVTVGTQVSGQIRDILVDFNSEVKAGQLIAQIDPETFEYKLRSAQSDVDVARAAVLTAQAQVLAARAGVSRAEGDLAEAQRTHTRNSDLAARQFIAQSEVDRSAAAVNSAREALKAAEAQLGVNQAQQTSAEAGVAQKQSALAQARIDLERTRITSPVQGIVIKRAVEKGQTVAASLQAPELFVIARNLSDMQVESSVDEADVGRIRAGQQAVFTIDAFPGEEFAGQVRQVRKAATNVSNVVTYVAIVAFNNEAGRLLPGMTANVRIQTALRENVLRVPNAALRVRLPGVEPAKPTEAARAAAAAASGVPDGDPKKIANSSELVLATGQKGQNSEKNSAVGAGQRPPTSAAAEQARTRRARLFALDADGQPRAYAVRVGVTDGSVTELVSADDAAALPAGRELIVAVVQEGTRKPGSPRPLF